MLSTTSRFSMERSQGSVHHKRTLDVYTYTSSLGYSATMTHIKIKLEREPDLTPENMKVWLLGDKIFDLSQVRPMTLYMFVKRSMDKFRRAGSVARKFKRVITKMWRDM